MAPASAIGTNLLGTYHCLEQAVRWRADVLFLSTSRVYPMALVNQLRFTESETRFSLATEQPWPGASADGIAEDFPLHGARSFYGMTKLASEMLLEEYLKPLAVSQVEAARQLGVSLNRLNEIVLGKRGITADTALRLGRFLKTSPQLWMRLQADWDLHQAMQRERRKAS